MTIKERYRLVIQWFNENVPTAETELLYTDAFGLLVAVILSAQCTDKRVNMITPGLLARFPTPQAMAAAKHEEIFAIIRSISYPNNKANHLLGMAQKLVTANVIASVIFNKPAMAVDTHVFRISERIGLTTNSKNPLQTELQLIKYIPSELIPKAHHWLILHGRYVCVARKPKCDECGIRKWCRYYENLKK
jgi:endonuclease-3